MRCEIAPANCSHEDCFWMKAAITADASKCWEWERYITMYGYGQLTMDSRTVFAHRQAWAYMFGSAPTSMLCHTCDNRRCVNPNHLYEGTYQSNTQDAVNRGRILQGEQHPRALLRDADIQAIRQRFDSGESSYSIAKDYPVKHGAVYRIGRRWAWKHV